MGLAKLDKTSLSFKPKLAPTNYRKMKPVTELECDYEVQYAGSGVVLKNHPLKNASVQLPQNHNICHHCGKSNTFIIFYSYYEDLVGKEAQIEIECKDCNSFTQFYFSD